MIPTGIENPESPAMANSVVEFQCDADREFTFCQFRHTNPMDFDNSEKVNNNFGLLIAHLEGGNLFKNWDVNSQYYGVVDQIERNLSYKENVILIV